MSVSDDDGCGRLVVMIMEMMDGGCIRGDDDGGGVDDYGGVDGGCHDDGGGDDDVVGMMSLMVGDDAKL